MAARIRAMELPGQVRAQMEFGHEGKSGPRPSLLVPKLHLGTRLGARLHLARRGCRRAAQRHSSHFNTDTAPFNHSCADEYRQCSAEATIPRFTGLLCTYSNFCSMISSLTIA